MSALDIIEDYGERGLDEFLDVLVRLPLCGDDSRLVTLAAAICAARLDGDIGQVRTALDRWRPAGPAQ